MNGVQELKRMRASLWIQALKEYNKGGMWCIPKKNTVSYDRVKVIMEKLKRGEKIPESKVQTEIKKIEAKPKKSLKINI